MNMTPMIDAAGAAGHLHGAIISLSQRGSYATLPPQTRDRARAGAAGPDRRGIPADKNLDQ
jgi:hypothetical protein